jgi:CDP-diglyceride synthetase
MSGMKGLDHRQAAGSRSIGRLGTATRILVGLLLLSIGVIYAASGSSLWWQLALGLAGFPAVLMLVQLIRLRLTKTRLHETGSVATWVNCAALVVLLLAWPTRNATLIFLGASMLLAALRGYGGCESLAVSNWLLRRDDQVGCLLMSPIDVIEAKRGEHSQ